jgi:hypothetical protein
MRRLGLHVLLIIIFALRGDASFGCLAFSNNCGLRHSSTFRKRSERAQEAMVLKDTKNK